MPDMLNTLQHACKRVLSCFAAWQMHSQLSAGACWLLCNNPVRVKVTQGHDSYLARLQGVPDVLQTSQNAQKSLQACFPALQIH